MTDVTFASLERLFQIYTENGAANPVRLGLDCSQCGNNFELEIHRTSRGFGINGGVLLVKNNDQLLGACMSCHWEMVRRESD